MGEQIGQCYSLKLFAIHSARYNWQHNSLQWLTERCVLLLYALANSQAASASSSSPLHPGPDVGYSAVVKSLCRTANVTHRKDQEVIWSISLAVPDFTFYIIWGIFILLFFPSLPLSEGIKTCHPHRTEFRLYVWTTINVTMVDFWCGRLVDSEAFFTKWRPEGKKTFKFEQDPKTRHLCSERGLSLHQD